MGVTLLLKDYIVPIEKLKANCDLTIFQFDTTKDIHTHKDIIGQERARKALEFGLSIKRKGYNIFVTGIRGTGRNTYSHSMAKELAKDQSTPKDWCYVYNFNKPENPKALQFEPSKGNYFKKKIESIISKLKLDIPKALTSREYEDRKNVIYLQYKRKIGEIIEELNDMAKEYDFIFKQTEKGLVSIPLIEGRAMKESELDLLSEEQIEELKENSNKLSLKAIDTIKKIRKVEDGLDNKLNQLMEKIAYGVVDFHLSSLREEFQENIEVTDYLKELEDDIVENIEGFLDEDDEDDMTLALAKSKAYDEFFTRYEVNLFIDNSKLKGSPVVKDTNPTYYNLLGKIEYVNEKGNLKTDHTRIKAGSIHEGNGGYLILQSKDILKSSSAWEGLKRALSQGEVIIENINKGSVVAETLKPEAIPIDLKVIIIGDNYVYQLLSILDEDFKKLFKIRADFDIEMIRNRENMLKIASFITYQCNEEGLKPFDKRAVTRVLEYSGRMASNQNKLTSRFNDIVELLYEADAWADKANSDIVKDIHIKKAINEKNQRNNKYEEKLHELFKDEVILLDTHGKKTGEINGLAVIDSGQYSFGRPNKITASTYVGKDGIINIEREVNQSGSIHDKGVLILSGYLGEKYAKDNPLSLSASITFEQSYDGIDGDSASSTELYALISSLAEVPINQAIAVTGSVNQKGMIQPIGGVNEKIEGFYKICKEKGFKGGEGVIIPYQNVTNLMLDDEVIEDVKKGKFTIYAVKNIDEGLEILTGMKSGVIDKNGNYEINTVNYLVQRKLDRYASINKDY